MPYTPPNFVDGTTPLNQTNMNSLGTQYSEAMQSFNQDLLAPFVESGLVASRHNSYASNVLADTPLRYYRLGESSGTLAADISGNGQNGTYSTPFTLAQTGLLTGDPATSVLGSATFRVTCPGTGLPSGNSPWSYVVWFKTPASYAGAPAVMGFGGSNTSKLASSMWTDTSGKLNCDVGAGTGQITSPTVLAAASVHMGAVTWDGTTLRLYLDGAASGTATTPGALSIPSSPALYVGANANGAASWTGNIQEGAFFGTALSAAAITALYTAGTTATTQVDLTSGVIVATQSDSTTRRRAISSTSFTTVTINTTYYLYAQPDGTTYWNTANTPAANSLAIAQVTTDGSGNVKLVTDMRTLAAKVLPNASGGVSFPAIGGQATAGAFGAPVIVAQTLRTLISDTALHTLVSLVIPVNGTFRITAAVCIGNGTANNKPTFQCNFTDSRGFADNAQVLANTPTGVNAMDGTHAVFPATFGTLDVLSMGVDMNPGLLTITYQSTGTPSDVVSVIVERLA